MSQKTGSLAGNGHSLARNTPEDTGQRGRGRPRDIEARARILIAALEVLEEFGFRNTTTEAIADRAGASKATIYRWWPNKAAVLIEALRERVAQENPFPDTGDLRRDIHEQLRKFIELLISRRGRIFQAFIAAAQSDPEVAEAFRSVWIRPRREEAQDVLRKHVAAGRLSPDTDLEVAMDLLYGPIYFRLLLGHAPLTPEFAAATANAVLCSFGSVQTASQSSSACIPCLPEDHEK